MIAALLTKIYNLSDVYDPTYMLWYTREASVAVYVANLPMIWPLLRECFPIFCDGPSRAERLRTYANRFHATPSSHTIGLQKLPSRKSRSRLSISQQLSTVALPKKLRTGWDSVRSSRLGRSGNGSTDDESTTQLDGMNNWEIRDIRTEITIEIERLSLQRSREIGEERREWGNVGQMAQEVTVEGGGRTRAPAVP